jgi:sarcosine oxidase subunit alpha
LICLSTGFAPASALLAQSGCRLTYDAALGEIIPQQMLPTVFAAGDVSGVHHLPTILLQGRIAGLQAAMSLGLPEAENARDRYASYQ